MNTTPRIHLLAASVTFQRAWCGLLLVDPHLECMTTDRARVTCRQCRRMAHLDRQLTVASLAAATPQGGGIPEG